MKYEDLDPWTAMRLICKEGAKDVEVLWDDGQWYNAHHDNTFRFERKYRRPLLPKLKRVPMKRLPPAGSAVRWGRSGDRVVISKHENWIKLTGSSIKFVSVSLREWEAEYSLPTDINEDGTRTWRPCWEEVEE